MKADVVVVLNYHGQDDTLRCVESLVIGSPSAQVLVVDNGSSDGTLNEVAARWPGVATLQTGDNLGFAGGMNRGLQWALERGARTVTVLNNDTIVTPGAVTALVELAKPGAAVSPEVRYAHGGGVWFGGGTIDDETALARHLADGELSDLFPGAGPRRVAALAGCCITSSSETWRQVGGFDERFFLIFEDSDWSMRARTRGVELIVDPSVQIQHRVSASFTGAYASLASYYYVRNGLLFGRRWSAHRGDTAWGSSLRALRFLRRQVLPTVVQPVRDECDWIETLHRTVIILLAVTHHLRKRYGRAPLWLERGLERRQRDAVSREKGR